MPLLRNPFARRAPAPLILVDDIETSTPTSPPALTSTSTLSSSSDSRPASRQSTQGFESVETVGMASVRIGRKSQDTGEYQMSVVNDRGVWVPPSPVEEPSWPRRFLSSRSSESSSGEIEQFSISRESFDSYRRSFDVAAKSPVTSSHSSRQSLDSRWSRTPRTPFTELEPPTVDEADGESCFEDVGLEEQSKAPPRRRGFFFRYAEEADVNEDDSPVSRFLMPGRKGRVQNAEMGVLSKPVEK